MDKLPLGWTVTTLDQVATWGSGGTPSRRNPEYYGGDIPWVKTGELGQRLLQRTEETITELGLKNSSAKIFPTGSVAIAMYGATIGKTSVLGIDAATNQACAVGIPCEELTTKEYVFHYLCSQKDAFIEAGKGGAQPNISQAIIKEWKIPLAPFNEQKRIADKLDAVLARVDACREHLNRAPAILQRFLQAVLAAATSGRLTEEWREETKSSVEWRHTSVGSILTDIRYGTAKKCLYEPKKTPVLRIPNILNGRVNHDDMKYAKFEKGEVRKLALAAGDILMIRSNGSLGLVGRTALVTEREEGFLYAGYLIRLRVNQAFARPAYVSIFLTSPGSRSAIESVARSTSGVNNINTEEIKALAISLPGVEEQDEIVRRVEALFAYADRLEARYTATRAQVERLTPALLAKAFRGELVSQDPNDEPASVLLERIRATRTASDGAAGPQRCKIGSRPKKSQKVEVLMLTRRDIQDTHLTTILKERGPLTAEALWSASQLDIDDFYDQLKDEEARGLLREKRGDTANAPRMLEAA
jgi:type I restriction enzyme S subunit